MAKSNKQLDYMEQEYLPNIPGVHQQEGFLLAIPESFLVDTADGISYNIGVAKVLPREECVYDLITSVESYQHTLAEFVNSDVSKLTPSISVLVTYFDEELALYSSLALWVNLTKVMDDEDSILATADTERMVMAFRNFVEYLNTGKYRLE